MAKKAIFWSKIHFFRNVARFARKLLSIRTLLLTYSKLCWDTLYTTILPRTGLVSSSKKSNISENSLLHDYPFKSKIESANGLVFP